MAKRLLVSAALIAVILGALAGCGNHPPEIAGVTALPNPVEPGEITNITCTATDADGDALTYEWESVDEVTTYDLPAFQWTAPDETGPYRFYVTVSDGSGGVSYDSSLVVNVQFEGIEAVTLFPPTNVGTRSISLVWSSAGPTWFKYEIYRSTSANATLTGDMVKRLSYPANNRFDTTWTDQVGIYPGTDYYYVVVVTDSAGNEAKSKELPVTTKNFDLLGTEYFGGGHGVRLASKNNYIFCAALEKGVYGFTATNTGPNPGAVIAPLIVGDWAWDIAISSDTLDVAFGTGGWHQYDIANPLNPILVIAQQLSLPQAVAIYSVGSEVFIGTTDPAISQHMLEWYNRTGGLQASILLPSKPTDIFVSGNDVYVTMGSAGLAIVSWSQATQTLTLVYTYPTGDEANQVYVSGQYAYVAVSSAGLLVLDVSKPANPSLAAQWPSPDDPTPPPVNSQGIYYTSDFAYLADGEYGMRVLDIGQPWSPKYLYTMEIGTKIMDVWVRSAGNKLQAILADWNDKIHMIEW